MLSALPLPRHARLLAAVAAAALMALGTAPGTAASTRVAGTSPGRAAGASRGTATGEQLEVIIRGRGDGGSSAAQAVQRAGGTIQRYLRIIDGVAARVPAGAVAWLRALPQIASVTPDARVSLHDASAHFDPKRDLSSMYSIAQEVTGAGEYWNDRITGRGVGVALIDSGVVEVDGLSAPGKVINGPDLSFESDFPQAQHLDSYGHGTHMAGIIAGRVEDVDIPVQKGTEEFVGMAPDARLVSIKVADASGASDVSQVIAAIDWVVTHHRDPGLNIRVLNLSFGTDGTQPYQLDPLSYAAEAAWRNGITVVVAAGNGGYGSPMLNNPAVNPFVIAVGGADGKGTYNIRDDEVPSWSSTGDGTRNPDLVAPGHRVVSLRDEGSFLDTQFPSGRVGKGFFRGSGTSQAAAVVSGAAALVVAQRPEITPDQVKALLIRTANHLPAADDRAQGAGLLDLQRARDTPTPRAVQVFSPALGTGSLEQARGTAHVGDLTGERDAFGGAWTPEGWTGQSWSGTAWSGGGWTGKSWSGKSWSGGAWTGKSWSGKSWSGDAWSGKSWSGKSWSTSRWGDEPVQ